MYSQGSRPPPPSEADHPSTFRGPIILDCSPPSGHMARTSHVPSLTRHQQAVPCFILVKLYHSFPRLSFEYVNHCNFEPFLWPSPYTGPQKWLGASFHPKVVSCLCSIPIDGSQPIDIFRFCLHLGTCFYFMGTVRVFPSHLITHKRRHPRQL